MNSQKIFLTSDQKQLITLIIHFPGISYAKLKELLHISDELIAYDLQTLRDWKIIKENTIDGQSFFCINASFNKSFPNFVSAHMQLFSLEDQQKIFNSALEEEVKQVDSSNNSKIVIRLLLKNLLANSSNPQATFILENFDSFMKEFNLEEFVMILYMLKVCNGFGADLRKIVFWESNLKDEIDKLNKKYFDFVLYLKEQKEQLDSSKKK